MISCYESDEYQDYYFEVSANSTDYDPEYYSDNDLCSENAIIDKMLKTFTPDDYEEGKLKIKTRFESLNESSSAVKRFQQFRQNISQKNNEFNKRLANNV